MIRPTIRHQARWTAVVAVLVGLSLFAHGPCAEAQDYPSRPVRFVVPFPAGGPVDLTARIVADRLATSLKKPFVVENRPGAAGNLGTEAVAKAAPDGYTLLFVLETPLTVSPALYPKLAFDAARDFTPIAAVARFSLTLTIHPSVPVGSLAEFVAYAKAQRQKPVIYGSGGGSGNPGHLTMEYFRILAGFEALHVPFRGNAEVVTNLLGGQVQAGFLATPGVLPHVQNSRIKALAISSDRRSSVLPGVPTVAESGYPAFQVDFHLVILAPAGSPEPIRALLEREVRDIMETAEVKERLHAAALEPLMIGGSETAILLKAAAERWRAVVKTSNIQPE